jgi:hypothetical protein
MFTVNNTIDDTSPLIQYKPIEAWFEGNSTTDQGYTKYVYCVLISSQFTHRYTRSYWGAGGTKTWTQSVNATASFKFNGTSVTIRGARRGNHGKYTVTLDGVTQTFDGYAEDPGEFQAKLFWQSNLTQGMHEVVVQNTAGNFLDIDCVCPSSSSPRLITRV